jgi:hypothetical protein
MRKPSNGVAFSALQLPTTICRPCSSCILQVFDFDRWKKHRSSSRYLRHVLGLFDSKVFQGLSKPLAYVMTLATGVALYHTLAEVSPAAARALPTP